MKQSITIYNKNGLKSQPETSYPFHYRNVDGESVTPCIVIFNCFVTAALILMVLSKE